MYAEEARKKFWDTLRDAVKEQGDSFYFTENKQWAIINKKSYNYHEPCVALDFLWRDEILRINVYIENNIPLYNKLKAQKEEVERELGFKCLWKENDFFTHSYGKGANTRRIEVDIPFNNRMLDFKALAIKAIPIIERYVEVFRGYIDC
jgi:hypothetical protein